MKTLTFLPLCLIITLNCFAWGKKGHQIVAEIAWSQLSPKAQGILEANYMDKETFINSSDWMDEVRRDKNFDYMKGWHYVNISRETGAIEGGLLVEKMQEIINQLKNYKSLTHEQVIFDLKILVHLVGDIVQPLHTGYESDLGGNKIKVRIKGDIYLSLHKVWDDELIYFCHIRTMNCIRYIPTNVSYSPAAMEKETSSYLPDVYSFKNEVIDNDYIRRNQIVVVKQLATGGKRLADILNLVFK